MKDYASERAQGGAKRQIYHLMSSSHKLFALFLFYLLPWISCAAKPNLMRSQQIEFSIKMPFYCLGIRGLFQKLFVGKCKLLECKNVYLQLYIIVLSNVHALMWVNQVNNLKKIYFIDLFVILYSIQ